MKKIGSFLIHSVTLFGVYLLVTLLLTAVLQVVLRIFVPADSWGEYLWKALLSYGVMLAVSAVYLNVSGAEHKRAYLASTEGTAWSFGHSLSFTLKNFDLWSRIMAFAVWPVIIPKFFGAINRLYVSKDFLASFPARVLVLATVDVPFILMQISAWVIVTLVWHRGRMR